MLLIKKFTSMSIMRFVSYVSIITAFMLALQVAITFHRDI